MSDNYNKITVVDAITGVGKTTWAIQYMNNNSDKSFVYVTPYINEINGRIIPGCEMLNFKQPTLENGHGRKLEGFNNLLLSGCNIATTHACFSNANDETKDYIRNGNYVLILDETLNALQEFNSVCRDNTQRVSKQDIKMLRDNNFISVDSYGRVKWEKESYQGGKFTDVERLANSGVLLLLNDNLLTWEFPYIIFDLFKKVYVLTYLFEGSLLKPYFEYHGLSWDTKSIGNAGGKYYLTNYNNYLDKITEFKSYIQIVDISKWNDYKGYSLSKTWYLKAHKNKTKKEESKKEVSKDLEQLKNNLYNYFNNYAKKKNGACSADLLWTCPKDFKKELQGKGYTATRKLTAEENMLPQNEKEERQKKVSCFLSCNARATNDFADRWVLAYCYNVFINPAERQYFEKKQIKVDEDAYALGMLIQWVFRSRIRKKPPENIILYIPSQRMRNLFKNWLDGQFTT